MISAGRLRFQAQVKRESTYDNVGKRNNNFATTVGYFRCDLEDVGSTETEYADGIATINTWLCYARYDIINQLGVTTADRLIIDGKTYRINGIRNEHGRNRLSTLEITEVV